MAVSRPIVYGGLLVVVVAAYTQFFSGSPNSKPTSKRKATSFSKQAEWKFPADELNARFDPPSARMRDAFEPLIKAEKTMTKAEEEQLMKVPANLTGGEPSWIFTGVVEVDGVKMALLENLSTKLGMYVKQGDAWKKCRLASVAVESISLVGEDGVSQIVYRFNPNVVPKAKAPTDNGMPAQPGGPPGGGPGGPPPGQPGMRGGNRGGPPGADIQGQVQMLAGSDATVSLDKAMIAQLGGGN